MLRTVNNDFPLSIVELCLDVANIVWFGAAGEVISEEEGLAPYTFFYCGCVILSESKDADKFEPHLTAKILPHAHADSSPAKPLTSLTNVK